MLIAPKRLKLQTSNFCACFQEQSGQVPLKKFSKRGVARVTWPPKFLVSRADHTHLVHQAATKWAWSARVTKFVIHTSLNIFAIFTDRPFKFYKKRKREEYRRFIYTMAHKWAWSSHVTKFVILHPLNYFCNSWRYSIQILPSLQWRITTIFVYKNTWIVDK